MVNIRKNYLNGTPKTKREIKGSFLSEYWGEFERGDN